MAACSRREKIGSEELELLHTESEQHAKGSFTASESGQGPGDFSPQLDSIVSPVADGIDSYAFPIACKVKALRNRNVSSCSTTSSRSDGDTASSACNDSRWTSGAFCRFPCDSGSQRKTSWADSLDHITEESLLPERKTPVELQVPENEPEGDETCVEADYTTLMLCELPCRVTQSVLVAELDAMGFGDDYDFLYVPTRFESGLGYGFVNFLTPSQARAFESAFQNHKFTGRQSHKICSAKPARLQGLKANVDQFAVQKRCRGRKKSLPAVVKIKEAHLVQS